MKKHLLLSIVVTGIIWNANAQITITSSDIATAGKMVRQAHDTLPTVSAGTAGASQIWNMATLNTHSIDTINFIFPSAAPQASSFPTANLAVQFVGQDTAYGYMVNNASSFTMLGLSVTVDLGNGPTTIIQKNTPAEILANFPATFGSSFTNNFITEGTFYYGLSGIDSIRQKADITKTVNADAWGNITTPLGTFQSLRFYEERHQVDSMFAYSSFTGWSFFMASEDSSKSYSWWANGVGFPLVETDITWAGDTVTGVSWLLALPSVGINEQVSDEKEIVYPNPAQNEVNFAIATPAGKSIKIYDVTGRVIDVYSVEDNITKINTSEFAAGSYSYLIIEKDSNVVSRGKLIIVK